MKSYAELREQHMAEDEIKKEQYASDLLDWPRVHDSLIELAKKEMRADPKGDSEKSLLFWGICHGGNGAYTAARLGGHSPLDKLRKREDFYLHYRVAKLIIGEIQEKAKDR